MRMLGVLLAAGQGSRLMPLTSTVSKHLLPVYDKPMIYYPISTLMLAGARELIVVVNPRDHAAYVKLLGDGSAWGMKIAFVEQKTSGGLADALLSAQVHIEDRPIAVVLGDNIFYGSGVGRSLEGHFGHSGATIFAQPVSDPRSYGVVEVDESGIPISLQEKPRVPKSNLVVPGIYFYDETAIGRIRTQVPSARGELEITDLNSSYLADGNLRVVRFPRGTAWLDAGTPDSLSQASDFIRAVEERQGILVSSPEEIAWTQGWIDHAQLLRLARLHSGTRYGAILRTLAS